VGAEYSAVPSDQRFRDAIPNDQGVADGTVCGSLSPISLSAPKVHIRWSTDTAEYFGTHRLSSPISVSATKVHFRWSGFDDRVSGTHRRC